MTFKIKYDLGGGKKKRKEIRESMLVCWSNRIPLSYLATLVTAHKSYSSGFTHMYEI